MVTKSPSQIWDDSPIEKKKQLLKTLGYSEMKFAKIKYRELPKRSGGMVQRDIERLVDIRNRNQKKK